MKGCKDKCQNLITIDISGHGVTQKCKIGKDITFLRKFRCKHYNKNKYGVRRDIIVDRSRKGEIINKR